MSTLRVLFHQMRFDVRAQLRNPPVVFFGLALPVLFLLLLGTIFGGSSGETAGMLISGITALGIISTTFVNLAIGMTIQRESGLLKRLRSTPLPLGAFIFGRVGVQIAFAFLIAGVLVGIGAGLYGAVFPASAILPSAVVVIVGAAAFACLGIAFSAVIPNGDAAPAMTNLVALPLYFISGIFFPISGAPSWLVAIGDVFPVKHLAEALSAAFDGAGSVWWDQLGVVALWGAAGVVFALRRFRWVPSD